jgi:hypothetical protein
MAPKKRLTPARLSELERLARARQQTFGSARVRVQNGLVALGLALYIDVEGRVISDGAMAEKCAITHDGMIVLKQNGYYPADPELRTSVRNPQEE